MTPAAESVLTAALGLDDEDRLELAEALLSSVEAGERPPFDESRREELRRRSEDLRSGRVRGVSWAEVRRRARESAGG
jgi:putative addiction module component (TIGR02574 family)